MCPFVNYEFNLSIHFLLYAFIVDIYLTVLESLSYLSADLSNLPPNTLLLNKAQTYGHIGVTPTFIGADIVRP